MMCSCDEDTRAWHVDEGQLVVKQPLHRGHRLGILGLSFVKSSGPIRLHEFWPGRSLDYGNARRMGHGHSCALGYGCNG
jgi:hypothetical protein